jgi:hypothetical protein
MFTETEIKFVPTTGLPMLKIARIRVARNHHGAFVRGSIGTPRRRQGWYFAEQ